MSDVDTRLARKLSANSRTQHPTLSGSHHLAKKVVASTASNCSRKWLHVTPPAVSHQPPRPKVAVSDSNGIILGSHMGSQTIAFSMQPVIPVWSQRHWRMHFFPMCDPCANPKTLEDVIKRDNLASPAPLFCWPLKIRQKTCGFFQICKNWENMIVHKLNLLYQISLSQDFKNIFILIRMECQ